MTPGRAELRSSARCADTESVGGLRLSVSWPTLRSVAALAYEVSVSDIQAGFFKGLFHGFLCQHSHLMVQFSALWNLTPIAVFHFCGGHEKLDKN